MTYNIRCVAGNIQSNVIHSGAPKIWATNDPDILMMVILEVVQDICATSMENLFFRSTVITKNKTIVVMNQ